MKKAAYMAGAVMIVLAAGCGPSHGASPQASISALASIPGADAKQILIKAGVPLDGTSSQQVAFAESMRHKNAREALMRKLEIPSGKRPAFESALLDAVKADHYLLTHAGRVKFFTVDLPNLLTRAL